MDGAYFRVHHFAPQLASPFPLLAAVGARTRKIEIGTAVIGGMMTATILAIFYIPLFYVLVRRGVRDGFKIIRERLRRRSEAQA